MSTEETKDVQPVPFIRPNSEVDRLRKARTRYSLSSVQKETKQWSEVSQSMPPTVHEYACQDDWRDLMKTIELAFDSTSAPDDPGVETLVPPSPEPPKRWPMFEKQVPLTLFPSYQSHTESGKNNITG
jgi:hypothetical protein